MQEWDSHRQDAIDAMARGDLVAAAEALRTAFAAAGARDDGSDAAAPVALILLQVDWHRAKGDLAGAETLLRAQIEVNPNNCWLWYRRAELVFDQGRPEEAWAPLATGLALDPDAARPAPRLFAATLWQSLGKPDAAVAVLRALARADSEDVQSLIRLARLYASQRQPRVAARTVAEAAERAPDRADLALLQGKYLTDAGDHSAAIAVYEAFETRQDIDQDSDQDIDIDVSMRLIGLCRTLGLGDRASAALTRALERHPYDARLLKEIFGREAHIADSARMAEALARLKGHVSADLLEDLTVRMHLARLDFAKALQLLRRRRRGRRDQAEAQQMAAALIGAGHFELSLRYLRYCLRVWPGFISLYVFQALRLGRIDEAAERLQQYGATAPLQARHLLTFTLAGFQGDFAQAQEAFRALDALGAARHAHRMQLARMIFIWLDPYASETFFERIPHPFAGSDKPLHRGGLPGQMMQEFELERRALPQDRRWTLLEWMRERPGSTMAAIRLIDAWRAGEVAVAQGEGAAIPRQIYQYWDAPNPPEDVRAAFATWAAAPGFSHRVFTRAGALAYLRDHFEPGFLQAFRLAQNSAQEADFLRLCLLSREGGVWADADDRLYGDLQTVLAAETGLIVYREPQGAALGNNFLAAPPDHPVIRHAARLASMALRRRDNEITWSKTGPGLLTRALGHYLARDETDAEAANTEAAKITVLDWPSIARHIGMHNQMAYKHTAVHWHAEPGEQAASAQQNPVWDGLMAALSR